MARKIVVYQKPTCTKCRQAVSRLKEAGEEFETVDYFAKPFSREALRSILSRLDVPIRDAVRWDEPVARKLELKKRDLTDDELVNLMAKHPDLIQRPIVVSGGKAVLARPAEKLDGLLGRRK
ncbi:MAG TPA: ArsC/Spx/MgsR family protein [Thermoanaerobaculia bacterium]|nr:ArsC/Spx/MgsR family protein [Thermoanaerobaculia bacterium]